MCVSPTNAPAKRKGMRSRNGSVEVERTIVPDFLPIPHWTDAVAFAAALHGDDLRKGTRIPYLTHVMAVAEVLAYRYPERDELILAGLLHDVVEDTDASVGTIEKRFGARVGHLVGAVSKDDDAMVAAEGRPIPPEPRTPEDEADLWRRRRAFMLQHLHGDDVDPDVLRLKAADAFANLSAILRDLRDPAVGPSVWKRFKVGADASLGYYQAIVDAVAAGVGDEPLAHDLEEALEAVRSAT